MSFFVFTEAPARRLEPGDFVDIAGVLSLFWQPDPAGLSRPLFGIEFDRDLTPEEARRVRIRVRAENGSRESLLLQAWQAYQANQAYLAIAAPTAADATAQVERLTRQMQALIRITVREE